MRAYGKEILPSWAGPGKAGLTEGCWNDTHRGVGATLAKRRGEFARQKKQQVQRPCDRREQGKIQETGRRTA